MPVVTIEPQYTYSNSGANHTAEYLFRPIVSLLAGSSARRVLDLGCGNGAFSQRLATAGFEVVGCDPSSAGIRIATESFPGLRFVRCGVYDDPRALGEAPFDAIVAAEVIEHLISPRHLPRFARELLKPGGILIVSTPFHGYLKNLAISLAGRWDRHWSPQWDGGHVKFWSRRTLGRVLEEEGFAVTAFRGAGRWPMFWKSMIVAAVPR
jgi:2-polyprenyl-6-hydroxyphenyl methylase/3-demethylubiquinone-9 3-methyltransferase